MDGVTVHGIFPAIEKAFASKSAQAANPAGCAEKKEEG
jgi:hypothetical protein